MKKFDDPIQSQISRARINIITFYILSIILLISGIYNRTLLYIGIILLVFAIIATKGLIDWQKNQETIKVGKAKFKSRLPVHRLVSKTIYKGYHHMNFSVAGTDEYTGKISRQEMLRKIKFHEAEFSNIKSVEFDPYDSYGSICYSVLINDLKIGDIPKEYIPEYEEYKSLPMKVAMVDILGGETRKNGEDVPYSCRIVLRFIVSA